MRVFTVYFTKLLLRKEAGRKICFLTSLTFVSEYYTVIAEKPNRLAPRRSALLVSSAAKQVYLITDNR